MRAMRDKSLNKAATAAALYLHIPARAEAQARADAVEQPALPFALTVRSRLREQGVARIDALSETIRQSQRVVLLFSASDVTLMRIAVPPLPAHRLRQALPALVEDRIIGDPADCVLAAGPAGDGLRTVAVIDSRWLELWVARARRLGARRISALPLQLCVPSSAGHAVGWLFDFPDALHPSRELVVRTIDGDSAGVPLGTPDSEASLPAGVLDAVVAMTAGRPLHLFVPPQALPEFAAVLPARQTVSAEEPSSRVELREASWEVLIEGAAQSDIDLIAGIATDGTPAVDWKRWRVPAALAITLLLLNMIALNWDWWRLHREGRQLEADMLRAYRAAFPDDTADDQTVIADPVSRMKQKRAARSRAAGEPSPGDFLWLSAALGDAWPAMQQATGMDARAIASIEYRDGSLLLRFKPGNPSSLEAARKPLAEHQLELASGSEPGSWRVQSAR